MNYRKSEREKFFSYNTLVGLIQAIEGEQTTVDLRGGHSATGRIEHCDSFMNIEMSHVLFRDGSGKPQIFENFFVQARNLRYVHIPQQINMRKALEEFYIRMDGKPVETSQKRTHREAMIMRRNAETLEHIQKLKTKKQNS